MITGKHLHRRTFLRGLGTAIALPMLDAMAPALARAGRLGTKTSTPRLAFVYVPNGIIMQDWTPAADGSSFTFPRILKPLEPLREHLLIISGLTDNNGRALGDGPGDHARAAASFLTGVHPKKTHGADIHVGVSADQFAARQFDGTTRFSSLELGCEDGRLVGNCDSGYSCAYSNSISWRGASTPNPPEINPRSVFERLFGAGDEDPATRAKQRVYDKSILDFVMEDTRRLQGDLGPTDRRKLDEYLTAVREIEKRIATAERDSKDVVPTIERPEGIPIDYGEHARLLYDMLAIAFQADLTRVGTFMMGREGSTRAYREIGVPDAHHPLTHHRNNPEMVEKVAQINVYHVQQFAYFLNKLKSTPDGDGTLLDHSMIVYGSGLSDGNRHTHHDLPVVVAGGGAGTLRTGRHVRYPAETPMTNLYLSLLDRMGVKAGQVGDSNGELQHLTDL
ncbi:MAG TPA: DUF1552 domain-containing protein [Bryobacteraceae bacterium]|jgi:hypothetical protein|nr:DUF1552 domain-containing protein [Bryobacteraceae bacterium]